MTIFPSSLLNLFSLLGDLFPPYSWLRIVGDKAVNAEDHTTFCDVEEPAYRRNKARYTQRERERERGTKSISIHKMQQLQIRTTATTKGYKVTLYTDSLRATALYAIYITSLN